MNQGMRGEVVIRTPDQRLRVFVSSPLGELAAERQAVARAVAAPRLTPVLFEAGARAAPGRAAGPDPQEASYRRFRTPAELGRLVRDDLAALLSERFAATRPQAAAAPPPTLRGPRPLPVETTSLVGREQANGEVASLFDRTDVRLVTLTGPAAAAPSRPGPRATGGAGTLAGGGAVLDRARAARRDFTLTERNAWAVVELCRRLEGLPLAIELAAARTRLLDPEELLGRLAGSLDALGTGAVDLPERQHTLRETVEWSVGLLGGSERSLLETVAIFVDGWTIEAAADVASLDEDRALDLTEALARHSLIFLDITQLGPRPRMLETIRVFVAERLAARPDVAEIGRRHADHYRALAEQAARRCRA